MLTYLHAQDQINMYINAVKQYQETSSQSELKIITQDNSTYLFKITENEIKAYENGLFISALKGLTPLNDKEIHLFIQEIVSPLETYLC